MHNNATIKRAHITSYGPRSLSTMRIVENELPHSKTAPKRANIGRRVCDFVSGCKFWLGNLYFACLNYNRNR